MANTALIQGAAMAAPKFNNIAETFNQSFDQTFTSISADIKAVQDKLDKEREAREKDAQNLYANAPLVKDGQVPEKFRQVFTNSAVQLKKDFASLVQNKDSMDPYEFIDKQNEYKTKVNDLNNQVNKLAEWQADYIEIAGESGSELFSKAMTSEEERVYRKMMSGKYEIVEKDGKMGFNVGADAKIIDGENESGFFSLDNLPTPKTVASPEHDSFSKMAESIAVTLGPKGIKSNSLLFNRKIEELQDAIKLQSEDKLDSILTDFAGKTGKSGVNAGALKNMKKEAKAAAVFSFYKNAAEDGIKAYNELYKPPKAVTTNTFGQALTQEVQVKTPKVLNLANIANSLGQEKTGKDIEPKMQEIFKVVQQMDPNTPFITRGMAFNSFVKSQEAEYEDLTSKEKAKAPDPSNRKEMVQAFRKQYGKDDQFFNSKNMMPIKINTKDPDELFNFLINNSDLSDDAKALFSTKFSPSYLKAQQLIQENQNLNPKS